MLDHHIQRTIVHTLKSSDGLTFTELRPADIDNKLFTYHLKIVIREGFIEKTADNTYRLTPSGEKLWKRMSEQPHEIALRPFSVIFMLIQQPNKGWLLYRRKTHPFKGRVAFMHCIPKGIEHITETAAKEVALKTGLNCTFTIAGSGFFHTYEGDRLDGFNNFTLLACENAKGILTPNDDHADYFWEESPDFKSNDMLPNMKPLTDKYFAGEQPFFLDEIVQL